MGRHEAHHEDRSPIVDRPQKPSQELLIVEVLEAGPGLASRRYVDESEKSSGKDLQNETQKCTAAKDVEPAIGAGRDFMAGGGFEQLADMQAFFQPESDGSQHRLFLTRLLCARARREWEYGRPAPSARRSRLCAHIRTIRVAADPTHAIHPDRMRPHGMDT